MTHSMGLVLPFSTRECPQRNQRWKRMEDYGCRIWQRRGPGKRWREQEEEVLSGKLSQITRSARVLQSPSCLGDGRLEGLSIWRREETSMGAGGWPKAHHSAKCGPWEVDGSWLVQAMRSAATIGQRMALQAPRMATSWAVTRAQEA
jgi:hypothetical protein